MKHPSSIFLRPLALLALSAGLVTVSQAAGTNTLTLGTGMVRALQPDRMVTVALGEGTSQSGKLGP